MFDVAIIGCGVIGAATAYTLARYQLKVLVLEAENDVADGTTKANSAIIHAGYDPEPGTRMARLDVLGNRLAGEICERLDVPFKRNGSLVLAFSEEEIPHLKKLHSNGVANGVPGIRLLDAAQVRELEPNLSDQVVAALYAPSAGVISPWEYALAMAQVAVRNGVRLERGSRVTAIRKLEGEGYELHTETGDYQARRVINAAGLHSEEIHNMVAPPSFHIQPTRGQYYLLDKSEGSRVNCVIFQCPTKLGKGILVSPTVHGNLIVGPDAELVDGDDTSTTAAALEQVAQLGRKSVPSVDLRASIRNFAGVRANSDRGDFVIEEAAPGFIDLAGIKSPGLSSAPAIALEAVELLKGTGLELREDPDFLDGRRRPRFKELGEEEKRALIAKDPAYGRVICRCETITEGEILEAVRAPIPPVSVDGVKRRCSAGMGRCQGGFCGPRVLEILSRELHRDPTEILKDKAGTVILTGQTKQGGN
ncbi:MAG: NAD(P)/FAD-dependent oxidoreductase [Oscillospiraceae bacterium]|nr:NAD(P)/FAD-dependent oxidoreductase [Oscillospiraceae bacterium]MCI9548201.1 NAD(P)/FAD-dependent oxidoreductase [Oscillospiraceae bacterium]